MNCNFLKPLNIQCLRKMEEAKIFCTNILEKNTECIWSTKTPRVLLAVVVVNVNKTHSQHGPSLSL